MTLHRHAVHNAGMVSGMERIEVSADAQLDDDNVMVTLTGTTWLLNVHASPTEWARLSDVRQADWNRRGTIRLGATNGSPAWWSVTDGQFAISVGHDDETSDVTFVLPVSALDAVEQALATLDTQNWG